MYVYHRTTPGPKFLSHIRMMMSKTCGDQMNLRLVNCRVERLEEEGRLCKVVRLLITCCSNESMIASKLYKPGKDCQVDLAYVFLLYCVSNLTPIKMYFRHIPRLSITIFPFLNSSF